MNRQEFMRRLDQLLEGIPEEDLLEEIETALQAKREIAVDVTVLAPKVQAVGVTAQLLPKTGVSFETAKAAAEKAVRALFTGALLGKSLYRAAISVDHPAKRLHK